MAKKQTRRSISVSRTTYERLKAFCETNNISMSQLVETRVNDFLGPNDVAAGAPIGASIGASTSASGTAPAMPRPMQAMQPRAAMPSHANGLSPRPLDARPLSHAAPAASPAAHASHGSSHPGQAGHAGPAAPATGASHAPQAPAAAAPGVPMTSAAARFAVEPPPPIIKPRQDTAAPKPAEKRPEQIFTF